MVCNHLELAANSVGSSKPEVVGSSVGLEPAGSLAISSITFVAHPRRPAAPTSIPHLCELCGLRSRARQATTQIKDYKIDTKTKDGYTVHGARI